VLQNLEDWSCPEERFPKIVGLEPVRSRTDDRSGRLPLLSGVIGPFHFLV
jgi:hypothetical protein